MLEEQIFLCGSNMTCKSARKQKVKVKKSLDWTSGLQEVEAPRISRQSAHKGGKVVRPVHWLAVLPRRYPWYSFLLEAESKVC
jgi:hypothetical protein